MTALSQATMRIKSSETDSSHSLDSLTLLIRETSKHLVEGFKTWQNGLNSSCTSFVEEVTAACASEIAKVSRRLVSPRR